MNQEWVEKYIDHQVLIAPSFGGSGEAAEFAWTRKIKKFISINIKYLSEIIEGIGAVHIHFPNFEMNQDEPLLIGPNGENYYAKDFPDLLIKYNKVNNDNINLLKLNIPYISKAPNPPLIKTTIIYNSKHSTVKAIKINKNWNEDPEVLHGDGDGTVLSKGIEYFCNKYKNYNINCHNINDSNFSGGHFRMLIDENSVKNIYNLAKN